MRQQASRLVHLKVGRANKTPLFWNTGRSWVAIQAAVESVTRLEMATVHNMIKQGKLRTIAPDQVLTFASP